MKVLIATAIFSASFVFTAHAKVDTPIEAKRTYTFTRPVAFDPEFTGQTGIVIENDQACFVPKGEPCFTFQKTVTGLCGEISFRATREVKGQTQVLHYGASARSISNDPKNPGCNVLAPMEPYFVQVTDGKRVRAFASNAR